MQLAGECPGTVRKQEKNFQLVGKVEFTEDGEDKIGYIIHESATHFQIMKLDRSIFNIRKPRYSKERYGVRENGEVLYYDLTDSVTIVEQNDNPSLQPSYYLGNARGIELTWVYPIRIMISLNAEANFRLLGNYFVTNDNGVIDELLSSCKFHI